MLKRSIAMLLALVMLMPLVIACGTQEEQEQTTTAATTVATGDVTTTEATTETTTEGYNVKDNLPEDLKFTGETISIISRGRDWCKDEVSVEALTGDVIVPTPSSIRWQIRSRKLTFLKYVPICG